MTEVIPSPVNESRSGSVHATGAIIIITAITYRSPPTSSGISMILFFLLDDRQTAIPGLVSSEVAPAMGWSCIFLLFLLCHLPWK